MCSKPSGREFTVRWEGLGADSGNERGRGDGSLGRKRQRRVPEAGEKWERRPGNVRVSSAARWGLRSLSPSRGPRDPQFQVPAQFLSRPRVVVFSSGHTELSVLWFIGVYYFDEGSCGLELRAQLLFLLFCFYFCNQNPPSPGCLVDAGGRVFVLLFRYHENSRCFLDVSGGLNILIEP